jgi:hypothetical protein
MARKPKAQEKEEEEASTSSSEHEAMDHDSDDEELNDDGSEDESDDGSEDDEEVDDEEEEQSTEMPAAAAGNTESSNFALADLTSFNTHQINPSQLYSSSSTSSNTHYTSATISTPIAINEDYLLNKAIGGTKQLLKELWKCPADRVDGGFMVAKLPGRSKADGYVLPRMLVSSGFVDVFL